jgi:hypothetical protein
MGKLSTVLTTLMSVSGALCVAVVDYSSGLPLESQGSGLNIELAAAASTEIVQAKLQAMKYLGLTNAIEDILITLEDQYHIIRPMRSANKLFIYMVLDRNKGSLALARRRVQDADQELVI